MAESDSNGFGASEVCLRYARTAVTIIPIATASTAAAAPSSPTAIVTALDPSAAYSVRMTILAKAIIGRFATIIDRACITIAESCDRSA
jgi:hypothetical protein